MAAEFRFLPLVDDSRRCTQLFEREAKSFGLLAEPAGKASCMDSAFRGIHVGVMNHSYLTFRQRKSAQAGGHLESMEGFRTGE